MILAQKNNYRSRWTDFLEALNLNVDKGGLMNSVIVIYGIDVDLFFIK